MFKFKYLIKLVRPNHMSLCPIVQERNQFNKLSTFAISLMSYNLQLIKTKLDISVEKELTTHSSILAWKIPRT